MVVGNSPRPSVMGHKQLADVGRSIEIVGASDLDRVARDPWLNRLWHAMKLCVVAVVVILAAGFLIHGTLVFLDCHQAEVTAKADAKRLYDFHCHGTGTVLSAQVLHECARQKHILERGIWLHAWHNTVQHHIEEIPLFAYCSAHQDMCALMTLRAIDALSLLLYWLPILAGSLGLWYFGPAVLGACLSRVVTASASASVEPPMTVARTSAVQENKKIA